MNKLLCILISCFIISSFIHSSNTNPIVMSDQGLQVQQISTGLNRTTGGREENSDGPILDPLVSKKLVDLKHI